MWIKGNKAGWKTIQHSTIFLREVLKKWARRMTDFTQGKSKRALISYLVLFNVLFLAALYSQIAAVFTLGKTEVVLISKEKIPANTRIKALVPTISRDRKAKELERLENFVLYLHFLKKDSIAKKR